MSRIEKERVRERKQGSERERWCLGMREMRKRGLLTVAKPCQGFADEIGRDEQRESSGKESERE